MAYVNQDIYEYNMNLDMNIYRNAWLYALKTFPSLRLRLLVSDNKLLQVIDKDGKLKWTCTDLSNLEEQESRIKELREMDRCEKFKLDETSIFLLRVIQYYSTTYTRHIWNYCRIKHL